MKTLAGKLYCVTLYMSLFIFNYASNFYLCNLKLGMWMKNINKSINGKNKKNELAANTVMY